MRTRVVIACSIVGRGLEGSGLLVPHGGIQLHVLRLRQPLCLDILVVDGVEQSRAIDADGRLQAHVVVLGLGIGVEGRLRDAHLGIDERILLAVLELHGQSALHLRHVLPLNRDLALVDRCLEGRHGLRLRHARHLRDVGIVVRMIDDQQVAVANLVGTILGLALAVTVGGVAGDARVTHPGRSQSLAGLLLEGVEFLEEAFARNEVFLHTCSLCGRSDGRIAGLLGRSQLSAGIPLLSREVAGGLAEIVLSRGQRAQVGGAVVAVGTGCQHACAYQQPHKGLFSL